jgi:hypothetical protein
MTAPMSMIPKTAPRVSTRAPASRPASTPRFLKLSATGLVLGTLVFLLVVERGIASVRHTVQTVGKDAVPSIVAAEEIRATLARAHAHALRAAALGDDAQMKLHDRDLAFAADRLVTAAQNITYGDEERAPIVKMIERTNAYSQLVGAARTQGAAAGPTLRRASRLMRDELLPAAEALDAANFTHLDREYAASRAESPRAALVLVGGLLLGALAFVQWSFARRFKRLVNVPLALATFVVLGLLVQVGSGMGEAFDDLRVAKADAFDSIHLLWKARAVAQGARGDEALLALDGRPQDEAALDAKLALLATGRLDDATLAKAHAGKAVPLQGYLGDELGNVTFAGERGAAVALCVQFRECLAQDAFLRVQLGHASGEERARCLAQVPGLDPAFDGLDAAIGQTMEINVRAFDASVAGAFDALDPLASIAAAAAVATCGLVLLGVRSRLVEYAV